MEWFQTKSEFLQHQKLSTCALHYILIMDETSFSRRDTGTVESHIAWKIVEMKWYFFLEIFKHFLLKNQWKSAVWVVVF